MALSCDDAEAAKLGRLRDASRNWERLLGPFLAKTRGFRGLGPSWRAASVARPSRPLSRTSQEKGQKAEALPFFAFGLPFLSSVGLFSDEGHCAKLPNPVSSWLLGSV